MINCCVKFRRKAYFNEHSSQMFSKLKYVFLAAGGIGTSAIVYTSVTGHERFFKSVFMPVAQQLDPERSHVLGVKLASWGMVPQDKSSPDKILVSMLHCYVLINR